MRTRRQETSLLVTDIDNTLFDWVHYYVEAFSALLDHVEALVGVPFATLAEEAKAVFAAHGSIEYPFLVQELPSVMAFFGDDLDGLLNRGVRPAREVFNVAASPFLRPYPGVLPTLERLKADQPRLSLVALTDAPRYVAMWKLNKLGLLSVFDAVYGLADPRLPTSEKHGRVKVDPEILLKHLQQSNFGFKGRIRILPDDYEKPGTRGLKTVLMDFELDEPEEKRRQVLWVGDNERKDVELGHRLGVRTAWAAYGTPDPALIKRLNQFSPPHNIDKNAVVAPTSGKPQRADHVLESFVDLLSCI